MLALVQFDWSCRDRIKSLKRDDYLRLRDEVEQLELPDWPNENETAPSVYVGGLKLIDLMTDGKILTEFGLDFTVKRFKGTYRAASVHHQSAPGGSYHLHVAIPAIGLLAIDEVKLLDDACTDNLGDHLNDGWRIIAVCPPDAQRRPDYILGRSSAGRAERSS